jgi:hypothetical protein
MFNSLRWFNKLRRFKRFLLFGVWCLWFGVDVFDVWCLVFGVWCLVFGVI